MEIERRLIELEERFWKGDADFYRAGLTDDAIMVFAEAGGVLTREETIQAIAGSPRWVEVELREPRLSRLTDDAVMLTYRARARRPGDAAPYAALASSAYVRVDGDWQLAFHQQTPETTT